MPNRWNRPTPDNPIRAATPNRFTTHKNNHNPMIMKQNITNFGGGSKTYLRPEVTATEVVVETGFAASEAFPGGNAKPFDAWGDRVFDAYGDPIEE